MLSGFNEHVEAAWQRYRVAAFHYRLLHERGEHPGIMRAQARVMNARFLEFRDAFDGVRAAA